MDEIYFSLNERQLRRIYEPGEGLFVCESMKVIRRALDAGYRPHSFLVEEGCERDLQQLMDDPRYGIRGTQIFRLPREKMKTIGGYALTGGILSAMYRRKLPGVEELAEHAHRLVILDDVENPTNVGAVFRSAAALGMDGVILTKGCSDPLYRRCARVSMGTVFRIPWTYGGVPRPMEGSPGCPIVSDDSSMGRPISLPAEKSLFDVLHDQGFTVAALALREDAAGIEELHADGEDRLALVLGNEDHGVSEAVLDACDQVVMIPMAAGVDSLNVAAASAVAFWQVRRERKER